MSDSMIQLCIEDVDSAAFVAAIQRLGKEIGGDLVRAVKVSASVYADEAARLTPPQGRRKSGKLGFLQRIPADMFVRGVYALWHYARRGEWHTEKMPAGFTSDVPGDEVTHRIERNARTAHGSAGVCPPSRPEDYSVRRQTWTFESEAEAEGSRHKSIRFRGTAKAGWHKAAYLAGLGISKRWQNRENTMPLHIAGAKTNFTGWLPEITLTNAVRSIEKLLEAGWVQDIAAKRATNRLNKMTRESVEKRERETERRTAKALRALEAPF